jgi:branched-chain amino acid transport system permease protein
MNDFIATNGTLVVQMLLGAILGLSLYLPMMAGQLSLASPGFYALGGYIAAILSTTVLLDNQSSASGGFSIGYLLLELFIAAIVCGTVGVLVGVPVLRLRGIYLAIATIAFVQVLHIVAQTLKITGEARGIFGIPQPFDQPIGYLWIVLPLLIFSIVFIDRLEKVRVGRALLAIREDELAADAMGINPTRYKVFAFTLGAILAGLAGVISAHFLNTWNAKQGTFDTSIIYLTFVLIGGSRTWLGPVLGGMAFTALPEVLRYAADIPGIPLFMAQFLRDGRLMIFGLLIVLGTIFFPQGLVNLVQLKRSPGGAPK